MSDTVLLPDGISIRVERDVQTFDTYTPSLDPGWKYADAAGHTHSGADLDATLEWVVTGEDGCGDPDCCGETWSVGEYRCLKCAEVIKPGTYFPGPQQIVTGESWYINDEPATKEQCMDLVAKYRESR